MVEGCGNAAATITSMPLAGGGCGDIGEVLVEGISDGCLCETGLRFGTIAFMYEGVSGFGLLFVVLRLSLELVDIVFSNESVEYRLLFLFSSGSIPGYDRLKRSILCWL